MIVLDASALLDILLNTPAAPGILARIFADEETLHAPYLLDIEIAQVLRRYSFSGDLTAERGREALDFFALMPITRYPHEPLLPRIWDLRHNVTAYDAAYVALAEALAAPLVTRDKALAASAGHRAKIELV